MISCHTVIGIILRKVTVRYEKTGERGGRYEKNQYKNKF